MSPLVVLIVVIALYQKREEWSQQVEPWSVPAGTGNEAGTCESASCQEIQRAG